METLTLHAAILSVPEWRPSRYMLLSYRYSNGDPHVTCYYPIGTVKETLPLHVAILSVRNEDPHVTFCYPIGTVMETLMLHAAILLVP